MFLEHKRSTGHFLFTVGRITHVVYVFHIHLLISRVFHINHQPRKVLNPDSCPQPGLYHVGSTL